MITWYGVAECVGGVEVGCVNTKTPSYKCLIPIMNIKTVSRPVNFYNKNSHT